MACYLAGKCSDLSEGLMGTHGVLWFTTFEVRHPGVKSEEFIYGAIPTQATQRYSQKALDPPRCIGGKGVCVSECKSTMNHSQCSGELCGSDTWYSARLSVNECNCQSDMEYLQSIPGMLGSCI